MTCISTASPSVLQASTPQPLPWMRDATPDPLALTEEKARARDAEAQTADRGRFWSWAEVRNALRDQSL